MKHILKLILFILAGSGIGYLYYHFFGCNGTCPITSNPFTTMAYFGVVAGLLYPLTLPSKKES